VSILPEIPVVDVREGGPIRHAIEGRARARALRDDCLAFFPQPSRPLLPVMDALARYWLTRARSPYASEVARIAEALAFPGIWFLNGSYQWCCTSLAREDEGVPWLLRTLDWPFPGLGRHVTVAHMAGPAGDYLNVTWPGYVGVLTAMAPGRFAAAINQAPLWRRTRHPWLRPYDIALNGLHTFATMRHMPPDQLLRHVCEECGSFAEARRRLETVPIARPAIFTLAGCAPGEACVVERTEEGAVTHETPAAAANDWLNPAEPWEARVGGDMVLTCSFADAAGNSRARREALAAWRGSAIRDSFAWVTPPVLNQFTRLAVEMCPATGTLGVVGYEAGADGEPARPATQPRRISLAA
jgi:hypothetical protein